VAAGAEEIRALLQSIVKHDELITVESESAMFIDSRPAQF